MLSIYPDDIWRDMDNKTLKEKKPKDELTIPNPSNTIARVTSGDFKRRCKRCGKPFYTNRKRSRVCIDCWKPKARYEYQMGYEKGWKDTTKQIFGEIEKKYWILLEGGLGDKRKCGVEIYEKDWKELKKKYGVLE